MNEHVFGGKQRRGGQAATLTDVAREAGVGESTASRVLRKSGSFSDQTNQKVLEAAARLGYVPNRIAGTLASTGSKLVGVIIPSLANIVFPDVLRGANSILEAEGLQSVVGVTEYDQAREENLVASLLAWRPAGLLIAGLEHSEHALTMLKGAGIRIVELGDIDGEGIDIVVGLSNYQAGRASAKHLLSRNYRRIGYIGHDLSRDLRAGKRFRGFNDVLTENGMSLIDREIVEAPSSIPEGRAALTRLLERSSDLDAVYFSNDDMAIGGYFHCLSCGIAIPGRLALFGYNGLDVALSAPQPLSTIRTPRVEIGETGARLLCEGGPSTVVDVGFELLEGATS